LENYLLVRMPLLCDRFISVPKKNAFTEGSRVQTYLSA